jgi:hypothetical protein
VGHEQHRGTALLPERLQLVVQQVAGHRVERTERLVHQQYRTVQREGAGERDALPHPAGQLVRPPLRELGQVDGREQVAGALPAFGAAHTGEPEREFDVAGDGQPRVQRGFLEHQRRPARHGERAGGRRVQPGDQRQQRRLAAAGGADHADELTGRHVERDRVQREHRARAATVHLAHRLDPYRRNRRAVRGARAGRPDVGGAAAAGGGHEVPAETVGSPAALSTAFSGSSW